MTERLYYTDPALVEFDATIVDTRAEGDRFVTRLNRSAFYPTSGGQLSDRGTLGESSVLDVQENEDGDVLHFSRTSPGVIGQTVKGLIDSERRWQNRQMHTAQHIVSQTAIRLFDAETVSVHLGDEYGAVELDCAELLPNQIEQLEERVNQILRDNAPVDILFVTTDEAKSLPLRKLPTREGRIRIIQIGDYDWSACGGTHCNSTAEVGLVKFVGVEKMRGRTLLRFLSGAQALADYKLRYDVTDQLSKQESCAVVDLAGKFVKLQEENKQLRKDVTALSRELIPQKVQKLVDTAERVGTVSIVIGHVHPSELEIAGWLATEVAGRISGVAILLCGDKWIIAVDSKSGQHAGNIARSLCAKFTLRGGGSATAAQIGGTGQISIDQLKAAVREILAGA